MLTDSHLGGVEAPYSVAAMRAKKRFGCIWLKARWTQKGFPFKLFKFLFELFVPLPQRYIIHHIGWRRRPLALFEKDALLKISVASKINADSNRLAIVRGPDKKTCN